MKAPESTPLAGYSVVSDGRGARVYNSSLPGAPFMWVQSPTLVFPNAEPLIQIRTAAEAMTLRASEAALVRDLLTWALEDLSSSAEQD